tara:strand:- start:216 stop:1367 length:1152 start_codon:yes stop_codon:yes gene_type:complete
MLLYFAAQTVDANEIYINQAGNNIDMTIVQDGENNVISSLTGNTTKATISGNNTSTTFTQTGDDNDIGVYMSAGNGQQTITQTGNTNYAVSDCHGNNCSTIITQNGNNNAANLEFGNGGDYDNTGTITQDGDYNAAGMEANGDDNTFVIDQDGDNNAVGGITSAPITGDNNVLSITQNGDYMTFEGHLIGSNNSLTSFQGGGANSSFIRVSTVGSNNTGDLRQGKKADGSVDGNDSGNHEQYVTVNGDGNNVITSQVNSNGTSSDHHMAHIIDGDRNFLSHLQYADGKKMGFIEIDGDDNSVTLEQRNDATHFADIVLTGDDHTVYGEQRGGMNGAHSMTMDLTNNGGAYNISTIQNSANAQTYSLTGSCVAVGGCAVTVTQY